MWVYILHFDVPLHHARHYSGVTADLGQRMAAHEAGGASALTSALVDAGMTWRLAVVAQVRDGTRGRQAERHLKEMKNGPAYCPLCTKTPKRVPGTDSVPIELALAWCRGRITGRPANGSL